MNQSVAGEEARMSEVELGRAQIEWVRRNSPVLDGYVRNIVSDGTLKGKRIAVVVHLEAKTAFLATILADAGAEVIVAGSNPRTTRGPVVAALRDRGITVVAEPDGNHHTWEQELVEAAALAPEYIIDDGAELTMRMMHHRPELFALVRGVSEETTTGTSRLRAIHEEGNLPFATLTANDARCKHLFDNKFGTGQTTMQALLKITNRKIAGAKVVVIGYGYVGRGIAQYAKSMGAITLISETDPVKALEAHMDGHTVGALNELLSEASMVIAATGGMRAVGTRHFEFLRDDVVLANAGHHDLEIDVEALLEISQSKVDTRDQIETFQLGEKQIHVLSGGALVNIAGGSGHPVEIMDLTFAVQALGAHYLITNQLESGVHVIPKALDDSIAAAKLASFGVTLEEIHSDQNDDFGLQPERL